MSARDKFTILMADDDPDDRRMTARVLTTERLVDEFRTVENGEELMDYLRRRGRFDAEAAPTPSLILLDLNMPKMNGREALDEIKSDETLRKLPIVIFSTSKADEDVAHSYQLGANSYINKPDSYEALVSVMRTVRRYWRDTVEAPRLD